MYECLNGATITNKSDTQHNDTQHNGSVVVLGVIYAECREC